MAIGLPIGSTGRKCSEFESKGNLGQADADRILSLGEGMVSQTVLGVGFELRL